MSYTEIFKIKENGDVVYHNETTNSWRGAMSVWNELDAKYLPPYRPYWADTFKDPSDKFYPRMSVFDTNLHKEVWGLYENKSVSLNHRIMMGSTFDKVVVLRENFPKLIEVFNEFYSEYPHTSYGEQSLIIEELLKDNTVIGIAWNQTSVNSSPWLVYDENSEEEIPYNINTSNEHWDLFKEMEEKGIL